MAWNYRLLIFSGIIAGMILLIGCGQPATSVATGVSTSTPTLKVTKAPTRSANPGSVILRVDAQSHQSKDTITVTLINQSNQTISFPDHLTDCSVILLLRLKVQPLTSDSGQAAVNPCRSEILTRIHSLAAGQSLVVRFAAPTNGWTPGLYRAMLNYYTSIKKSTPFSTASAEFSIGPLTP